MVSTNPVWYGLWTESVPERRRLELMHDLLQPLDDVSSNGSLAKFLQAVEICLTNRLELHVELVPPGVSDGITWTIEAHCSNCKAVRKQDGKVCDVCRTTSGVLAQRKGRVLGLRPYLNLQTIVGGQRSKELVTAFLTQRESSVTD